ncbi:MAG TPA: prephenate/arogenate dehydrogenase family protein [Rhodospirillaceae bacterium]|nr:prephenate/arogenate dehydrogenase family protein [Rhodospirillaceae bacterium]
MFDKIVIIGMGMIGGSLAQAARANGTAMRIVALDNNPAHLQYAYQHGMIDNQGNDHGLLADADLVILAVPVRSYGMVMQQILPHLKPDVIVSDVGSTKRSAMRDAKECLADKIFIGGHPIAGREKHGPQNAAAEIFKDRWCVLTPDESTPSQATQKLSDFWHALGSEVEIMTPMHHDRVLAITSHLPQLIARTIVGTAAALEDELQDEVIKFSAGGFRDFTRMAAADPVMWRDIFLENGDAVLEMLQRLSEDIAGMQKLIRAGDGAALEEVFARAQDIRSRVIAARQAE